MMVDPLVMKIFWASGAMTFFAAGIVGLATRRFYPITAPRTFWEWMFTIPFAVIASALWPLLAIAMGAAFLLKTAVDIHEGKRPF